MCEDTQPTFRDFHPAGHHLLICGTPRDPGLVLTLPSSSPSSHARRRLRRPPPPPPPVNPGSFTPAAIFTSIALFGLMRFPLIFLPFALIQLSNALVSMRRLSAYFMLEERTDEVQELDHPGGLVLLHDLLLSPTCVAAHGGGQGRHRAA